VAFVFFVMIYSIQYAVHFHDFTQFFRNLFNLEMKGFFIATFIGFTFGALFFFYVQWNEAVDRVQKLREEKLIFQYETLKSQVNPHFLFNSLNSLSSLIRKDADLSEQYIQKLSTIYRYILENNNKELVPLAVEIEFVNNYFFLQKIRDEEKIELKVELNGNENIQVLPVSVQLLVENALKHNSATRKQPLEITVYFEGLDKLVVRNNLQKKTQLNNSSKIGLKNLNERSRLILNREIEIQETEDEFVVKMPVKLNLANTNAEGLRNLFQKS
jgi:LytS/YehU family sensor histidine kinase